ncbi:transglutaminase-like domain-containing protein [Ramlibacter alkalitolerans]|uniref:Transglutaminase domain-containing protein n=1 Tax=Ramlibacter alkalitolerans TaxID=2039631 RepID=A0ABS1JHI7_9BURK|nr:transglutaminase domain-containing protein [Ramlibacter alkalitolerans]MBL0423680.1 transglutaminase domain-containing protein [Ramlibacter alkalitolerans]
MTVQLSRRDFVKTASAALAVGSGPLVHAQEAARRFEPRPAGWRSFEVTTTVTLRDAAGAADLWLPVPSLETPWQRTSDISWTGNASNVRLASDGATGAKVLVARFEGGTPEPRIVLTNRVETQNRGVDWKQPANAQPADPADLRHWLAPSELITTDGIVRKVAKQIVLGARDDREKVQRIYDWVIVSSYREPKVRGCGAGDIKAMLESGNLSGKCADINALFVGLCRAAGVPARDIYGVRLVPSAFNYRELGANPASLKGAQHCRAEVYLKAHGWVAMDPADVTKVMRQETAEWIKDPGHPVVTPVRKALFGSWEGNWMGYNTASDVKLPGARQGKLGFFMYPQAETAAGARDPYEPDSFAYQITAREITA